VTPPVDLRAVAATGDGVAWSASPTDVNVNLVVLGSGGAIGAHRNDDVDVLVVGVDGDGTLVVDDAEHRLAAGTAALVPLGTTRAIRSGPGGLRYLTVHRARGPLAIRPSRSPR